MIVLPKWNICIFMQQEQELSSGEYGVENHKLGLGKATRILPVTSYFAMHIYDSDVHHGCLIRKKTRSIRLQLLGFLKLRTSISLLHFQQYGIASFPSVTKGSTLNIHRRRRAHEGCHLPIRCVSSIVKSIQVLWII